MTLSDLKPGDHLLYTGRSLYDRVIQLKTWAGFRGPCHFETYVGGGWSFASRPGQGVARYAATLKDLWRVLRPKGGWNLAAASEWFWREANGLPYGYADLLRFVCINLPGRGIICSEFGVMLDRAAGFDAVAARFDAGAVAPRDFDLLPNFDVIG